MKGLQKQFLGCLLAVSMAVQAWPQPDPPTPATPLNLPTLEQIAAARPTEPPPTPPPSVVPDSAQLMEHLKLLSEFLELPPEKLENIRKTIQVIEAMDEAERARMRKNLQRIQLDLAHTENRISDITATLRPVEAKVFKRYWLSLPIDDRKRIESELADLNQLEKAASLRQHIAHFRQQEARLLEAFRAKSAP